MRFYGLSLICFSLAGIAAAQVRTPKIALVNIQDAIVATTDGQNADARLEAEFAPRKTKLEEGHKALEGLQDKLESAGLSDDERHKLTKEIDDKTVLLNVETDQADADLDAAQKKVLAELGKKMVAVIADYAAKNGFAMVFDVSTSQAPLLYAENAIDITKDVVAAYESKYKKRSAGFCCWRRPARWPHNRWISIRNSSGSVRTARLWRRIARRPRGRFCLQAWRATVGLPFTWQCTLRRTLLTCCTS